jgi:acid phosphatase (class B)
MIAARAACASIAAAASLLVPSFAAGAESRWLTLAEFQRTLDGAPPMTVVFDIDDTALFSSFAMVMAEGAFRVRHPEVTRPYDDCRLFGAVNDSLDARLSRPKTIATALVGFHAARGDRIVFVTKRCASVPANDSTAHYLARAFGLKTPPTVRFTDLGPKVQAFAEEKPAISYGDSDSDIEDTNRASALDPRSPIRAVRIIRSRFSSNPGAQSPGRFGEDVIVDSDL